MRPDLTPAIQRVTQLREEAARPAPRASLLDEIEDALSEGYAHALEGDEWSMATEQRLHELMTDPDVPARARSLRELASEHARFQCTVMRLRTDLAALRRDRDRLHFAGLARSA